MKHEIETLCLTLPWSFVAEGNFTSNSQFVLPQPSLQK